MLPADTAEPATVATESKISKRDINNILNEAPLFAGLDDYILKQAERKKAETPKADRVKEKKKTEPKKTRRTAPGHPKPQPAPKVPRTQPLDPNAILLSVTEMCRLLKISRATLVRMDKSGKLPGRVKLGGSVRFHRETVETWLQSLIVTPTSP